MYGEAWGLRQLNNFLKKCGEQKTCVFYDEFHLCTKHLDTYIENNGITELSKDSADTLHIVQKFKSLIFGISASPFTFRDANTTIKWPCNIFFLPVEPLENQKYIGLLDLSRYAYNDYIEDPIIENISPLHNNKSIVKVVIFYAESTNSGQEYLRDAIIERFENEVETLKTVIYLINQHNKPNILACYDKALLDKTDTIIFIGHTCESEGRSFGLPMHCDIKESDTHILVGPTDIVLNENIKLKEKFENIVQVVGRATRCVRNDVVFETRLWFSEKHSEYFQDDGHLNTFFRAYNDRARTGLNEPIYNPPIVATGDKSTVCPPPTNCYKSISKKIHIEVKKLSEYESIPSDWIDLEPVYKKLPVSNTDKITDYHENVMKTKLKKQMGLSHNTCIYYGPSIDGSERPLIQSLVLSNDLKYSIYKSTANIVIPHPCHMSSDGNFIDVHVLTWNDTIQLKVNNTISIDNPKGYMIIDDYIICLSLKGQLISKYNHNTLTFKESNESIKFIYQFINSLPTKRLTIASLKKLIKQFVRPLKMSAFEQLYGAIRDQSKCPVGCNTCIFHKWSKLLLSEEERMFGCIDELIRDYNANSILYIPQTTIQEEPEEIIISLKNFRKLKRIPKLSVQPTVSVQPKILPTIYEIINKRKSKADEFKTLINKFDVLETDTIINLTPRKLEMLKNIDRLIKKIDTCDDDEKEDMIDYIEQFIGDLKDAINDYNK